LAEIYNGFESPLLVNLVQYSKEILIFSAPSLLIFGKKDFLKRRWEISHLDWCFLLFLGLTVFFFLSGIGEATVFNRAVYVKNILLICTFYFLGRNVKMDFTSWNKAFKLIFLITMIACAVVVLEKIFNTHFHSILGYAKYNQHIKDVDPQGTFGLTWTFEAPGGLPRFASIFANPLEHAASLLISAAVGIVFLISVKHKGNRQKYLFLLICSFICVLFAYSRATFAAYFLMLIFMALLLKYYTILKAALAGMIIVCLYIIFLAPPDILFYVIDTLTFQNSSSVSHIVDWLKAVNSIIESPFGIGLAMSGNAGGVEKDLIVGGENQYLIYGVQMGVIGMVLYIAMMIIGIRNSWKAFRLSNDIHEKIVPFVAASVKFGLLLPLFTANGEVYIYVALVSWWMIGSSETVYQRARRSRSTKLSNYSLNALSNSSRVLS